MFILTNSKITLLDLVYIYIVIFQPENQAQLNENKVLDTIWDVHKLKIPSGDFILQTLSY